MLIKDFDINLYVENRLELQGINNSDNRESFRKQVVSLLKYFTYKYDMNFFKNEKATHIFNFFPLELLNDKDKIEFLNHIFDLKEQVDGKIVANINKINVDNKCQYVEEKDRDFQYFYIDKEKKSELDLFVFNSKLYNRFLVRNEPYNIDDILRNIEYTLCELRREGLYDSISSAIDYISDVLLQIFNYWVITIGGIELEFKLDLINNIEKYFNDFRKRLNCKYILQNNNDKELNLKDIVGIYTALLIQRNNFGQYVDILEVLEEEENNEKNLFENPGIEYRVNKKVTVSEVESLKSIITEDSKPEPDNYPQKLKNTKEMIRVFSDFGMRNANINNVLDLKVYFREFYISDSKYKIQAKTIVRKYIDKYKSTGNIDSFDKTSEYQFIREKLNRGYFRETVGITLYKKKNEIQIDLYETILSIFLTYDYEIIIKLLHEISRTLIMEIHKYIFDEK